ncbi:MAG: radical SAM protein [Candidatus Hodarchaeales archaeon]
MIKSQDKPFLNSNDSRSYIPRGLLLQWHLTERCNIRCSHCYQESYKGKELDIKELINILDQYKSLLRRWRSKKKRVWGHVTVTGGEPFVRTDFVDFLKLLSLDKELFSFAILTNGYFIDEKMARTLKTLGPRFVQVSLEGTKQTNDKIREKGSYDHAVSALKFLGKEKIRTLISFTAYGKNYREFPEVVKLAKKMKVSRVWSDRLIPSGSGQDFNEYQLSPSETRDFFQLMHRTRPRINLKWLNRTEVGMYRALQFLVAGGRPYHCTAGDTLLTVQPNGDLLPCRRMPIRVSNLLEVPLLELYYKSEVFLALRDRNRVITGCEACSFSKLCRGGLKCLSYAVTGSPFNADPGCWLAKL